MGLEDRIIRVPEALACAVSARLRDLCKFNGRRSFLVDEILGREPGKLFSFVDRRDIHNLLGTFVNWLYTGCLATETVYYHLPWSFGYRLGAPKLQNDALRMLCSNPDTAGDHMEALQDPFWDAQICFVWGTADFSKDDDHGCDLDENTVYWGNKQILRFIMDVMVYMSLKNWTVTTNLWKGRALALQLNKLMVESAKSGTTATCFLGTTKPQEVFPS